ncbi:MAG: ABC transporter ATP-binding protein [Eubacteriales bacterium]
MRGIDKTYQMGEVALQVLFGIDFEVQAGEFVCILGPSGSGKSTLMNIIGCLDTADAGSYRLNGKEVSLLSENQLAVIRNRAIGFVFQSFQLLGRMSALDNVMLPLIYGRYPQRERAEVARQMLEKVGLGDKLQNTPAQLSGGQQQRVAIARALAGNPSLILADEPTGALDQKTGVQIMEIFEQLHREGKTIVMITHSPRVSAYASRVVRLLDGRLYREGEGVFSDSEEAET